MRDFDIRVLLKQTELSKYINDDHSKVVEELKLPLTGSIIDMAVINGSLHGFEIKSAIDTLQRLPTQLIAYTKIFDYLTVVTEEKHSNKILKILPDWVGLYVCCENNGVPKVKKIKKSKQNNSKESFFIAKLLWRTEILDILREQKIAHKKVDRNWILCENLANNINVKTLSEIVRQKLKGRPADWKTKPIADYEVM